MPEHLSSVLNKKLEPGNKKTPTPIIDGKRIFNSDGLHNSATIKTKAEKNLETHACVNIWIEVLTSDNKVCLLFLKALSKNENNLCTTNDQEKTFGVINEHLRIENGILE